MFWMRLLCIVAFVVFTMADAPLIDLHQDGSSSLIKQVLTPHILFTLHHRCNTHHQQPLTLIHYPNCLFLHLISNRPPALQYLNPRLTFIVNRLPHAFNLQLLANLPNFSSHQLFHHLLLDTHKSHHLVLKYRIHHHHKCNIHRLPIIQTMLSRRLPLYLLNTHLLHHISLHFTLICHTLSLIGVARIFDWGGGQSLKNPTQQQKRVQKILVGKCRFELD